jgi:hypothetical protein
VWRQERQRDCVAGAGAIWQAFDIRANPQYLVQRRCNGSLLPLIKSSGKNSAHNINHRIIFDVVEREKTADNTINGVPCVLLNIGARIVEANSDGGLLRLTLCITTQPGELHELTGGEDLPGFSGGWTHRQIDEETTREDTVF